MSETAFSINDLLRRKFQTSLIIICATLCVASTFFLLLFSEKIGFGISLMVEEKLTAGFSTVFSRFIWLIGILVLMVGAVILSFMVFMMMSQRVRDVGLMKAAGCPNDMIFGYFMTELLIVAFLGCFFGIILGILADFASRSLLSSLGFQVLQQPLGFWAVLQVFLLFFVLALVFGVKPILDAAKVEPAKAISPTFYFGLSKEPGFRTVSRSGLTIKMALRSLFRRRSATIRIFLCLTAVFVLVTVAVAGGVIADSTTKSWIERAVGRDIILIAHHEMCDQYKLLISKFSGAKEDLQFDYTNEKYSVSENLLNQLDSISGISDIDTRLILKIHVKEVSNFTINPDTQETITVGDDREGESVVVGVELGKVLSDWILDGRFLTNEQAQEAIIGDSLAQKMFSVPLSQGIRLFDSDFDIVGVCLDPINNGNITYVPLKALQKVSSISKTNIVLVKIDPSANRAEALNQIRTIVSHENSEFVVFELNETLDKNLGFLGYIWSSIMFLPLFSLVAASLCLVGYVMLAIDEQRQELGVLRALGAKPKTIVKIVSAQSFIVLLSSYVVGVAFGMIVTLLILVPEPLVTSYTVLEIAGWLLTALAATFIMSLYPAMKFARKPILEIMS